MLKRKAYPVYLFLEATTALLFGAIHHLACPSVMGAGLYLHQRCHSCERNIEHGLHNIKVAPDFTGIYLATG